MKEINQTKEETLKKKEKLYTQIRNLIETFDIILYKLNIHYINSSNTGGGYTTNYMIYNDNQRDDTIKYLADTYHKIDRIDLLNKDNFIVKSYKVTNITFLDEKCYKYKIEYDAEFKNDLSKIATTYEN